MMRTTLSPVPVNSVSTMAGIASIPLALLRPIDQIDREDPPSSLAAPRQ
jgi:hypothetical protein